MRRRRRRENAWRGILSSIEFVRRRVRALEESWCANAFTSLLWILNAVSQCSWQRYWRAEKRCEGLGAIRFLFFALHVNGRDVSLSRSLTHVPRSRCERAGSATPRGRSSSVSLRRSAAGESPELEHFFVFRLFASAFFELNYKCSPRRERGKTLFFFDFDLFSSLLQTVFHYTNQSHLTER